MAASTPISETSAVRANASWLRSPQRVWLRRALFQVHLWTGIALSLYAVVIGLSGSILVFSSEIEEFLNRDALTIRQSAQQTRFEQAVRAIELQRPGWRGIGMEGFSDPGHAAMLLMQTTPATANYRMVSFNPYTGQVVLDRMRLSGFLGVATNIHYYLLASSTGLRVSGWMAVWLLILCVTGLVLWWPGVRRWNSGLLLRRRASWQRFNWDLHSVVGFWSCAFLLLVTFTGVYFAFPDAVRDTMLLVTGGPAYSPPKPANSISTLSTRPLTIDEAMSAARRALPANAPPGYFQLPSKPNQPYSATGYYVGSLPYSQLVQVTLDPHTGAVLSYNDTRQQALGMRVIQYFFTLHFGSFGGTGLLKIAIKVLWVLLGIVPAVLAVTGLVMYWNRKLRPLWR
jgi:uncharacterized iron-regulated membrane protein